MDGGCNSSRRAGFDFSHSVELDMGTYLVFLRLPSSSDPLSSSLITDSSLLADPDFSNSESESSLPTEQTPPHMNELRLHL